MAAAADSQAVRRPDSRAGTLYAAETASLSPREACRLIAKTWPLIAAHRRLLALKCILAFTSLTFFLLTPWSMKIIIDNVIDGHALTGLPRALLQPLAGDDRFAMLTIVTAFLLVAVLLVGMVGDQAQDLSASVDSGGMDQAGFTANDANDGWSLWNGMFGLLEVWITLDLTQRLNQTARTAVYERFLGSPLKLYSDQKIGDAVFRVMHDTAAIAAILYRGLLAPLLSIVMFGLAMVIITAQFHDQPLIPILAALALPAVAIGTTLFSRPLRDQGQRMRERGSEVLSAFEERIAQVHLIKAFGQEERERAAVDAASRGSFRAALKMLAIILTAIAVVSPLVGALILFGTYELMMQVIAGKLTLGDVTLLGAYAYMLGRPMSTIGGTWAEIQGPIAGLRRMHSVLDRLGESEPDGTAREIAEPIRELQLHGLSVAYD
ncbi:MAG: ABC transporter ATP-binding protein, partial [Candidatus Binataceae bacterium]